MQFVPEPYQEMMIDHLLKRERGALFAGMSLGKTASTLYALNELFLDQAISGALIVAPLRVCNVTWPMEVDKWDDFRWMKVANLRTSQGREALAEGSAHLYLINYEMLPKFAEQYLRKAKDPPFNAVVWDEISMAKNHNSKRINSVRKRLQKVCQYHWGLTGTPASNSYLDLFAQVRLLDDGALFSPSYGNFRSTYFYQPNLYMPYKWEIKDQSEKIIQDKLKGFALSMKTSDYLPLPDVILEDFDVPMPADTKKLYKELEQEFITIMESGEALVALNSAVLVGKLLQFTSGAVYNNEKVEILNSVKIDAVKKILKGTGNTLIVYNYKHELERLKKALPKAVVFADAKDAGEQKKLCGKWNSGGIRVLLVHPQSMSHGLNLQGGGSDIIWVSLTYSRERYDQLNARLIRRGQENETHIYRILMQNSIDYAITEVLRSKGDRQDTLLKALKLKNQ